MLARPAARPGATRHAGGTYVCIEGPQFSTRAESELYRSWGMDVIGMTNLQEAKLAREAEICYATLAMVTDYDCWHPEPRLGHRRPDHRQPGPQRGDGQGRAARRRCAACRASRATCECASALRHALVTPAGAGAGAVKRELAPIIGKYMKAD